MYDVIIIGGGAAALSATSYALSKQLKVLMIYETLGGKTGQHFKLRTDSDADFLVGHILVHLAFPEEKPVGEAQFAGEETVHLFERQIKARSGLTLRDRVIEITQNGEVFQVMTADNGMHRSTAVIVATGVSPRTLDSPGAREFLGQGLGYSATTYARLLDNKTAAVIGSSVRALRGAAELSRTAAKVYLIVLDQANIAPPLLNMLHARPNVEVLEGYNVVEITGSENVEAVVIERHSQRRSLSVDAAFVDLGLRPNSAMVHHLVKTDREGFIWVDDRNATTMPGLFAAGDVTTAFGEQVLIAIGDGARAALSAYDYILSRPLSYEMGGRD